MDNLPHIPSPPIAPGFYLAALVAAFVGCLSPTPSYARPSQRWAQASPERQEFFKGAVMPALPPSQRPQSCCDATDAYETDEFDTKDGQLYAILTCNDPENCPADRDDGDGGTFPSLPNGTRVLIPSDRILPPHQPENRTGHGWVFISQGGKVFCYSLPTLF